MRDILSSRAVRPLVAQSLFFRALPLLLAVLATSASAWISVIAGFERGGLSAERLAWASVGVVLLLGAHLIPALTRGAGALIRLPALLLWVICLLSTGYGHATFFLAAQRHAGDARAAVIERSAVRTTFEAPPAGRSRNAIARDQARVTQALAVVQAERCSRHCEAISVRRESLKAHLAELAVEASEAQRRERAADLAVSERQKLKQREDQARADPVTRRVATLLGVPAESVDLSVALGFGWLLEAIACLGWVIALSRRVGVGSDAVASDSSMGHTAQGLRSSSSVTPNEPPVAPSNVGNESTAIINPPGASTSAGVVSGCSARLRSDDLLTLTGAITAGQVRPTVKDIRRYMRCSQRRAMDLRNRFLELASGAHDKVSMRVARAVQSGPRLVHSSNNAKVG